MLKTLPKREGVVIVGASSFGGSIYAAGIVLWLERLGIAVRVPDGPDAAQGVGERRVYHGGPVREVVTVADGSAYDTLARDPTERLVAYRGTRSPTERVVVVEQLAGILAQYRAGAISAREVFERSSPVAQRLGTAVGVFARQ
jgi:hypothetical protein